MRLPCVVLSKKQFESVHTDGLKLEFKSDIPSWWNKFATAWEDGFDQWAKQIKGAVEEDYPTILKERLDFCLGEDALHVFDYAGIGSSRAAFVDGNGFCLKIGYTAGAKYQFQRENVILNKIGKNKECFPKLLASDKNCQLLESVVETTNTMWLKTFGVSCMTAVNVLKKLAIEEQIQKEDVAEWFGDTLAKAKVFATKVLFEKNERKWLTMKELFNAIKEDNGISFDIDHADNWGIADRNGQKVFVCLDIGL